MQVIDLTTDELKTLIRETVAEALGDLLPDPLGDLLPDPDEGLTVKEEFKQELLEIQQRRQSGTRGISAEEAMKRLGLGI